MTNFIICPIYNGLSLTRALLPDLLAQDIGKVEVLFLLNGACDGSKEWLQWMSRIHRNVHVVQVPPPHGVSRAWNHGLEWCFENGSPYVLVINNDIRLHPSTYRWLVEDGGQFVTAVGARDPEKIVGLSDPNPEAKRPHPDFSCYLIRRECWKAIGPFDERFVNYTGDGDFHLRMTLAGIEAYCLDIPFYHVGSGTIKEMDQAERDGFTALSERDRAEFVAKWGFRMGSYQYYEQFPHRSRPDDPGAASE